jgi:glycosyltransferase involved in cell wall biosynthesis
MKKPTIGIMSSSLDNRKARGTALVGLRFLERLEKSKDSYDIYLIHFEPSSSPLYSTYKEILIPHLPSFLKHTFLDRQMVREALFWMVHVPKLRVQFDMVHYLHPRLWPSYICTRARKIIVSGFEGGHMLPENRQGNTHKIFRFTSRFLNSRIDHITACSESGRHEIITSWHMPEKKVRRIYLGADDLYYMGNRDKETLRKQLEKYALPDEYLLAVSRFDPHKNILTLLYAFKEILKVTPSVHLVLLGGPHTPGYSEKCTKVIDEINRNEKRVHVISFVEDSDMPSLYACSLMLVYPSLHEGFGLPVLEAMASGTPVVTSNCSSIPEVAGNAAIYVEPGSVESISTAVVRLLHDKALQSELIKQGQEQAKKFSWDTMTQETIALYEEALRDATDA